MCLLRGAVVYYYYGGGRSVGKQNENINLIQRVSRKHNVTLFQSNRTNIFIGPCINIALNAKWFSYQKV